MSQVTNIQQSNTFKGVPCMVPIKRVSIHHPLGFKDGPPWFHQDLSAVLYPNDATYEGKELRLRQQLLGWKTREVPLPRKNGGKKSHGEFLYGRNMA